MTDQKFKKFVGVDGEGGTVDGRHSYYLLRVGDRLLYKDGEPLRSREIFEFLSQQYRKDEILVSFFFDYDVTQIISWLPKQALDKLFDVDGRRFYPDGVPRKHGQTAPVRWWGYEFDYIPHKFFKIKKFGSKNWVIINDTSGFFQTSFVKALKTWEIGTPEQLEIIEEGKKKRKDLTGTYSADDIEYNRMECQLLASLMDKVRDAMIDVGYLPTKWQGAGSLASKALELHNVAKAPYIVPKLREASQFAYYGGRFELSMIGEYGGPVTELDIASAYPTAVKEVPCMIHGSWHNSLVDNCDLYLAKVRFTSHQDKWGPLPYRDKEGRILYPGEGIAWAWSYELDVIDKNPDMWSYEILDRWNYERHCNCISFDFVDDVYQKRQELGKSGQGLVLKLLLNSLYGKTAQSVGAAPWANVIWAGIITSITRARLLEVIANYPDRVVMTATDGIYLLGDQPIQSNYKIVDPQAQNPQLGEWESRIFENMFFVQPGVYWSNSDHDSKIRSRGTPARIMEERLADFRQAWEDRGLLGEVEFQIEVYQGGRLSWRQNNLQKMGQWIVQPRVISFKSNNVKRNLEGAKRYITKVPSNVVRLPIHAKMEEESYIYAKPIGGVPTIIELANLYEAPDFAVNDLEGAVEEGRIQ